MFIRTARKEDSEIFSKWFLLMPSFRDDILSSSETYTLCAFTSKSIVGFMVVQFGPGTQVLTRFVSNPESSDLEKALASSLLVKTVITLGYMNERYEIYFMGDNAGTNRIAEHAFRKVEYPDYAHVFEKTHFPVYKLNIKDLEKVNYGYR